MRRAVWVVVMILGLGGMAAGQCPDHWLPGQGLPGLDGTVYAMTTWDPDGAGPQPELLVVGGNFTVAGETLASNIAVWNGSTWQSLSSGMNYPVFALTVYNGDLIAGGSFITAGGMNANHIARWNGSTWQSLGSGMSGIYPYDVYALLAYNGELIAGGEFTSAGEKVSAYWARWGVEAGDLSCDDWQDMADVGIFAGQWLGSCTGPEWCNGADFDRNGAVDLSDLLHLAGHWMQGP